jgi:hypothetical protein
LIERLLGVNIMPNHANLINLMIKILQVILIVKGEKYGNKIIDRPEIYINTAVLNKIDRLKTQVENNIDFETNDMFDVMGYLALKLTQKCIKNKDKFISDIKDAIKD